MLYVDLPTGGRHGWGVVGDNLASALARITPIERLLDDASVAPLPSGASLLQSITRPHLRPRRSPEGFARHVGYAVFEHDLEARRAADDVRSTFDVLVAASRWGEEALREGGLKSVTTIHHGVDGSRFCLQPSAPGDSHPFVVFSGGKFELRKAQDVVVRAFGVFAARHADVRLVAAWHNPWPRLSATMAASPHFPWRYREGQDPGEAVRQWVANTGLDMDRVSLLPPLPNEELARVYAACDVGLFPNRCEGSTNLVMMEFMACGRPVIATDFSGHRDLLTDENSLPLRGWRLQPVVSDGTAVACWCEPDLDEVVSALETAYQDRQRLRLLGRQAAADMTAWTWDAAARAFLEVLEP